jgi:hypothetical protein
MNGSIHPDDKLILDRVGEWRENHTWGELTLQFQDGRLKLLHHGITEKVSTDEMAFVKNT